MSALHNYSDAELLGLAQTIYDIPSLAAWRAAELKALRRFQFEPPVLETRLRRRTLHLAADRPRGLGRGY